MPDHAGGAHEDADEQIRADGPDRLLADESEQRGHPQGAEDEADDPAEETDHGAADDGGPDVELIAALNRSARPEEMLRPFTRKGGGGRLAVAQVVLCVPSGITKVEREAVQEATLAAGARAVYLVEEPMAAAIGAGLPVAEPRGSMIVDIGGGTTEVAVISLGGIVSSQSIKVGGYEMDEAVAKHVQGRYGLLIGEETAEQAKLDAGSAWQLEEELECLVGGRDLQSGMLRRLELGSEELRSALDAPVQRIVTAVKDTLEGTPPELAADISDRGIVLAGGGALLRGIDLRIRSETGLDVARAESPLTCVVLGAGESLNELETLKRARPGRGRKLRGRRFQRR